MAEITLLIFLIVIAICFGWACLLTWAVCFIAGLLGFSLAFSWKLVLAIWIISSLFSTTINIKKG